METKTNRPLATVGFSIEYVVYADDLEMIQEAKVMILEDLANASKFNEESEYIDIIITGKESEDRISSCLLMEDEE
ncbi:MAG: hypothetical protein KAU58_01065 [Candidatus Omnitrophica bacterium]|nr:hypothetical protein [Candidatus Omnitrophota bacterium]